MTEARLVMTLRAVMAAVLFVIALVILAFVSLTAFQLAIGAIEPLKVSEQHLSSGDATLFGIILQTAMFTILILIAFILMKFGTYLFRQKPS